MPEQITNDLEIHAKTNEIHFKHTQYKLIESKRNSEKKQEHIIQL
jgi:hypothetical protein